MTALTRYSLTLPPDVDAAVLAGPGGKILSLIEDSFDALITVRGDTITFSGDNEQTQALTALFGDMVSAAQHGQDIDIDTVRNAIELIKGGQYEPASLRDDAILTYRGRAIRPKTTGQKKYVDAMRNNMVTFGIGPAGTGKTYLAMAMAVAALKRKEIGRIVLTRPVVEAGESLGYLPGSLMEKVDPYIRPLYDALFDMMDMEKANALLEGGVIEIAPLAFMRGRTLNDSFIILDEAQNTTPEQMKMFLTRLGFGSKMVITGDITQLDLPKGVSGLKSVRQILGSVDNIAFCDLTNFDVVRHSLVAAIVAAYENYDGKNRTNDRKVRAPMADVSKDTTVADGTVGTNSALASDDAKDTTAVDAGAGIDSAQASDAPGNSDKVDPRENPDLGFAWAAVGGMHDTLVAVGKGERPKKPEPEAAPQKKRRVPKPEPFKPDTGVVEALLGDEMWKTLQKVYSKPRWNSEEKKEEGK